MKPRNPFDLFKLGLAAYRLANMASNEAGPLDIFQRLRFWVQMKEYDYKRYEKGPGGMQRAVVISKQFAYWKSFRDLLRCPYCLGVWFALVLPFAPRWLVDWLAIAGVQHVVQKAVEK